MGATRLKWLTASCAALIVGCSSQQQMSHSDSDSVPDETDNCPTAPNTDQADADGDGHGDVCDGCLVDGRPAPPDPNDARPGANGRPPGSRSRPAPGNRSPRAPGHPGAVGPYGCLWTRPRPRRTAPRSESTARRECKERAEWRYERERPETCGTSHARPTRYVTAAHSIQSEHRRPEEFLWPSIVSELRRSG